MFCLCDNNKDVHRTLFVVMELSLTCLCDLFLLVFGKIAFGKSFSCLNYLTNSHKTISKSKLNTYVKEKAC